MANACAHRLREYVLISVSLIISALAVSGCKNNSGSGEDARPVRTIVVDGTHCGDVEIVTGQIIAHVYVNAAFKLSGKVAERNVSIGDSVRIGQAIARLDGATAKDALTAATADLAAATATLTQAEKAEKRARALVPFKAISQNDYDGSLCQLKSAQAQVKATKAKMRIAQEQSDDTILRAGIDGIVTDKFVEAGEIVNAGQPILRIADNKSIDAVFDMPAEFINQGIAKGQNVKVCLSSQKEECADASVFEIAPDADPVTRTYTVKASFKNTPSQFLLGATVQGRVVFPAPASLLIIPASALTKQDDKPAVWLVEPSNNTVRMQPIKVVRYTSKGIAVENGLKTGDRIITAGVQALHQGQKVKIIGGGDDKI